MVLVLSKGSIYILTGAEVELMKLCTLLKEIMAVPVLELQGLPCDTKQNSLVHKELLTALGVDLMKRKIKMQNQRSQWCTDYGKSM